jgi:serine protease Do
MTAPTLLRLTRLQACTVALLLWTPLFAQTPAQSTEPRDGANQATQSGAAQPAAATISFGSGFVIDEGYILTAWHVVQRHPRIMVGPNLAGRWIQGEVVKSDPTQDLALIKAPLNMPALSIAASSEVPIGLEITVVGYPLPRYQGITPKITQGLINGIQRQAQATTDSGMFQISAEISMGSSGGPVFAPDGSVIAMVQRKLQSDKVAQQTNDSPTNVNYALRSSALIRFLQESPARPRIAPLALNDVKRPHEIFRTLGPSVVSIIGRGSVTPNTPSSRDEPAAGVIR